MRGTDPMQDGAILPIAQGETNPHLLGNHANFQGGLSFYMASPETYGRGIKSASNKPSECNIGNLPIRYFVQRQNPPNRQAPQTRKLISHLIPGGNRP